MRDISDAELFRSFCIYFQQFIKVDIPFYPTLLNLLTSMSAQGIAKERCTNAHKCLCGGTGSSERPEDVRIHGYHLFNIDETYTIELKTGSSRKR